MNVLSTFSPQQLLKQYNQNIGQFQVQVTMDNPQLTKNCIILNTEQRQQKQKEENP